MGRLIATPLLLGVLTVFACSPDQVADDSEQAFVKTEVAEPVVPTISPSPIVEPTPIPTVEPVIQPTPIIAPIPSPSPTSTPTPIPTPIPTPTIFETLDAVGKATVRIQGDLGQGTGVIIDKLGYILTANHVVHEMASVVVKHSDGKEERGLVLGRDEIRDLAVVKINGRPDLPVIPVADFSHLKPGEKVFALGYPGFTESISTTSGVVSAILIEEIPNFTIVQTDTAFYSGLSGGPLITRSGELVALITSSPEFGAGYTTGIDRFTLETIEEMKAGALVLDQRKTGLGHSNQNPAPLNHMVRIIGPSLSGVEPTVHEITIREVVRGEQALEQLKESYPFNPEPMEGTEYLLALVELRYVRGPQGETDWIHQVDFGLISSHGVEYELPYGIYPAEPFLSSKLYPGAIFVGWTTWVIDADDPAPLLIWGLDWQYRGHGFFTLATLSELAKVSSEDQSASPDSE